MKRYFWNLALLLDQAANTIFGPLLNAALRPAPGARFGDPGEYLSSVFGKNVRTGACVGCHLMCRLLSRIDSRHCEKSIQDDEGANAV